MKSLLQQVQSRISKRRTLIFAVERSVEIHYYNKILWGVGTMTSCQLANSRLTVKEAGDSQRLDKKIFRMLLEQERINCAAQKPSKNLLVLSMEEVCNRITEENRQRHQDNNDSFWSDKWLIARGFA